MNCDELDKLLEKTKRQPAEMHVTYDGNGKCEATLKGEAVMLGYLATRAYQGIFKNLTDEDVIDAIALAATGTICEIAKERKKQVNGKAKVVEVKVKTNDGAEKDIVKELLKVKEILKEIFGDEYDER